MNLQDTFYIVGIVYMSIGLILLLALVIAVFVIKAKINAIHHRIEEKFQAVIDVMQAGEVLFNTAKDMVGRKK